MAYSSVAEIVDWACRQTFHLGGPKFLSETLYTLMATLNSGRETAWDVDAALTATLDGPERIRCMARLRAEFTHACTMLTAHEQERLLNDVRSGGYDEPGRAYRLSILQTPMIRGIRQIEVLDVNRPGVSTRIEGKVSSFAFPSAVLLS